MHQHDFLVPIAVGLGVGLLTRIVMTQTTYRQFPSRPHGMIIHMFLGFVASLLGALVIPAIIKPDFTAGVFVSIGTAQFHTMRSLERDAWRALDKGELIPRGEAYIEGLAASFEARIFMVIATSAVTTLVAHYTNWIIGLVFGVVLALILRVWKQGKSISDIADVTEGKCHVEDGFLYVDNLIVFDPTEHPDTVLDADRVLVCVVIPKNLSGTLTLCHHAQQQTMLHNASVTLGLRTDPNTFSHAVVYDPEQNRLVIAMTPVIFNPSVLIQTVSGAPVLESIYRKAMPQMSSPSRS